MVDREIYSIADSWSNLYTNLKENERGINNADFSTYLSRNWCHKNSNILYVSALSKYYNGSIWINANAEFDQLKSNSLDDQYLSSPIPLSESGVTALDASFTATSIMGALNELKGEIGGDTEWTRVVIDVNNDYVIPRDEIGKNEFIHTSAGLMDSYINPGIPLGETGEIALNSWFSPKISIIGALNKIAEDLGAWSINEFDTDLWEVIPTVIGVTKTDIRVDVGMGLTDGIISNPENNDAIALSEFGATWIHENFTTSSILGMLNELMDKAGYNDRLLYNTDPKIIAYNNRLEILDDLRFVGTGTGLIYGGIVHNPTDITTKYQITDFNLNTDYNDTVPDHSNDHITINRTGVYYISVNITSALDDISSREVSFGVFINNGDTLIYEVPSVSHRFLVPYEHVTLSTSGFYRLTAGDTVELWHWSPSGLPYMIIRNVNLSVIMVGG